MSKKSVFRSMLLATFFTNVVVAQVKVVTAPLSASSTGIWQTTQINVCWEDLEASNPEDRNLVRTSIENTWERVSAIRFLGWDACEPHSQGIRIQVAQDTEIRPDTRPQTKGLGTHINGLKNGIVLNFDWKGCRRDRDFCISTIAVHEFGHALGFAHEHNRPDCNCEEKPQGRKGDWLLTPCDINSVMNYCNPSYNNNGELSGADINGVRALYGTGNDYAEFTDASGKITIALFSKTTDVRRQHGRLEIPVSDEFVVVGGGGYAQEVGEGALLTASYPNDYLSSWIVASKDHGKSQPHFLQGFAMGLKVEGMTRSQLKNYIKKVKTLSSEAAHPEAMATLPPTYQLIGGGFNVLWQGYGSLPIASYPSSNSWVAKSKDHGYTDIARIETYAIGINPSLPVGKLIANLVTNTSEVAGHPQTCVSMADDYAITCGGAFVSQNGEGNLIWKIQPTVNMSERSQSLCVASKQHIVVSPEQITAYLLGIKLQRNITAMPIIIDDAASENITPSANKGGSSTQEKKFFLTLKQEANFNAANKAHQDAAAAVYKDKALAQAAKVAKIAELRTKYEADVKGILNEQQYTQWLAKREARKAEKKGRK